MPKNFAVRTRALPFFFVDNLADVWLINVISFMTSVHLRRTGNPTLVTMRCQGDFHTPNQLQGRLGNLPS
jgi:hypothetical protein